MAWRDGECITRAVRRCRFHALPARSAQENVLELLVNLARKKLFALDGPHMKGFPPAAIDKMRQASETKVRGTRGGREVRLGVMRTQHVGRMCQDEAVTTRVTD